MEDECGIYNCSTIDIYRIWMGSSFPVNSSEKILLNREIVNRRGSWRFAMDQILQKNNLELQIKREARKKVR